MPLEFKDDETALADLHAMSLNDFLAVLEGITAKVGKGKACKTKAQDFIIQVSEAGIEVGDDKVGPLPKMYAAPSMFVGPALVNYSIANAVSPKAFRAFIKSCKELGRPPQGVVARWGFEMARSKSNVEYSAVSIDILGVLPDHKEDPELWGVIIGQVKALKAGQAVNILNMLSGSSND